MRKLKFNKDLEDRWYIDLPEWTGSRADLEMVCGADIMLDYMAEGKNVVNLYVSETQMNGFDKVEFVRLALEMENGAYYKMEEYKGINVGLEIWLCDVTKFVFGYFPQTLFVTTDPSLILE